MVSGTSFPSWSRLVRGLPPGGHVSAGLAARRQVGAVARPAAQWRPGGGTRAADMGPWPEKVCARRGRRCRLPSGRPSTTCSGRPSSPAPSSVGGSRPDRPCGPMLADGRTVFLKAAGLTLNRHSPGMHRREAGVLAALPPDVPAPRLLGVVDDGDWVVLAVDWVEGRMPVGPVTAADVERLFVLLDRLASAAAASSPPGVGPFAETHRSLAHRGSVSGTTRRRTRRLEPPAPRLAWPSSTPPHPRPPRAPAAARRPAHRQRGVRRHRAGRRGRDWPAARRCAVARPRGPAPGAAPRRMAPTCRRVRRSSARRGRPSRGASTPLSRPRRLPHAEVTVPVATGPPHPAGVPGRLRLSSLDAGPPARLGLAVAPRPGRPRSNVDTATERLVAVLAGDEDARACRPSASRAAIDSAGCRPGR